MVGCAILHTRSNPPPATPSSTRNASDHAALLRQLHAELEARGLLKPSRFWSRQLALWLPVFFLSYYELLRLPLGAAWAALVPVAAMGMLTFGFVGHDAGHYSLSSRRRVNDFWGHFGMTFVCGMSFGNWRRRHNDHHFHCQEIERDPDTHFGVLFSVYPHSTNWHSRLGRFFLGFQKWSFWPLTSLYWVTLRYDGLRALFERPRDTKVDRLVMPQHWLLLLILPGFIFGWGHALAVYFATSMLSSLATGSVFAPNHIGMRRLETGERLSYLERQITTSRNVTNPRVFDFFFGGLNAQIEHHLFPRVPHNRYRAMRPVVREFCRRHSIGYREQGFFAALGEVGRHLGRMTETWRAEARADVKPKVAVPG